MFIVGFVLGYFTRVARCKWKCAGITKESWELMEENEQYH